jgi:hypothetical protein
VQLDKTSIVIRERNYFDILDLALRVIRTYPAALFITMLLGTIPFAALNYWYHSWTETLTVIEYADETGEFIPYGYLFDCLFLIVIEMPLATMLTTIFLGQVTFTKQPSGKLIARDAVGSLWQMLVFQVIIRGLLTIIVITWFILFSIWPYLNEVILLERNPLTRKGANRMTTMRRNSALHSGSFGDLFGRWVASLMIAGTLLMAIWIGLWIVGSMLLGSTGMTEMEIGEMFGAVFFTVYLQAAIWIVVHFFSVVRFLGYLDLRIRREGWEVELMLRAEAARMARQPT